MDQAGLVERQDSGDRRSYKLRLTAHGQRQLKKYKTAVRQHDERVARQLSAAERQQYQRTRQNGYSFRSALCGNPFLSCCAFNMMLNCCLGGRLGYFCC